MINKKLKEWWDNPNNKKKIEERNKKISLALTGKKLSKEHIRKSLETKIKNGNLKQKDETKIKISETLKRKYKNGERVSWNIGLIGIKTNDKGQIPWNKNKKTGIVPWNKNLTKEKNEKLEEISKKNKGKRTSPETEFKKGKESRNYIDGRSKFLAPARYGDDWEAIRYLVYLRDKSTCQHCGIKGTSLDVHHKIPFLISFDNSLDNLITLCRSCHMREERRIIKELHKGIVHNKLNVLERDK